MRSLVLAIAACGLFAVAACETIPTNPAPAEQTVLDEKALIGVESAAIALNVAAEAAVDSGLLQPGSERAVQVADALAKVRSGVILARQAYNAGNLNLSTTTSFEVLELIGLAYSLIR